MMRSADALATFTAEALRAGHSRKEIFEELSGAGWADSECRAALSAWVETDFLPPVPRPRPYISVRDATTYALMFLALVVSAWNITSLGFGLFDFWIPDIALDGEDLTTFEVRQSIAILAVSYPVFLFLNLRIMREADADPARRRSLVRNWFGYVTLLLAVIALFVDGIAVLYALLNGDLTARFIAKAALVALTAALVLTFFFGELSGVEDAN